MNHEIKTKWLAALRSGDYRKSVHVLKRYFTTTKPGYCCMGVLCDIIKDDFGHASDLLEQNEPGSFHNAKKSKFAVLDQSALHFTGVSPQHQRTLTSMNDKGATFERIANYIEKHV